MIEAAWPTVRYLAARATLIVMAVACAGVFLIARTTAQAAWVDGQGRKGAPLLRRLPPGQTQQQIRHTLGRVETLPPRSGSRPSHRHF